MKPSTEPHPNTDNLHEDVKISCFHRQTIEEYVECLAHLYDFEVSQLSPGNFSAQSSIVDMGDVVLLKRNTAQKYVCMGHSSDTLSFTFPLLDMPFYSNSVRFDASKQKVILPGDEFRTINPANMEQIIVVIKADALESYLSPQEIGILLDTMKKLELMQVCKIYKASATQFIHHLYREILYRSHDIIVDHNADVVSADSYSKLIILFLYQYVHYHSQDMPTITNTSHERIVSRGLSYIESNPQQAISLDTLSKNVYASRRAVQYAFAELTGLTPLQYIKTNRMNHIRRQLLCADRQVANVSDILHECNITNFGRFSVEYRKLFEEGPKETIARSAAL